MKRLALALMLALAVPAAASAACVAEYKATRSNPLQLDYGFIPLPEGVCSVQAARPYVRNVLAQRGWTLEKILSVRNQ